jgi:hypothetical protein
MKDVGFNDLIAVGGPIVAAHECLLVTLGKDEFLLWELNDNGYYDVIETLPRACRGRFITDVACMHGDAQNQLDQYMRRTYE